MTKLTKTEAHVLAQLTRRGRWAASWATGRGAMGGKVSDGAREYQAYRALVAKGLAIETTRSFDRHYQNGHCVHCAHIGIRLPAVEG